MNNLQEEIAQARKDIKQLYKDLVKATEENENLYIIPKALYNQILSKIAYLDEKATYRGKALKQHLADKVELRKRIRILEEEIVDLLDIIKNIEEKEY